MKERLVGKNTMSDMNQDIIDKHTKVCICKAINKSTMKKVIAEGADTLLKVQQNTTAGSGSCKGRRCTPKIEALLEEMKEQNQ